MLFPADNVAVRPRLDRWCESHELRPRIVGEFDDTALMKAFGQRGAGVFIGPTVLESEIKRQYQVRVLGRAPQVIGEFFAISVERRVMHPCVVAIVESAKERLFATGAVA